MRLRGLCRITVPLRKWRPARFLRSIGDGETVETRSWPLTWRAVYPLCVHPLFEHGEQVPLRDAQFWRWTAPFAGDEHTDLL